ncbi:hypothetical protein [Hyphomicrobium sp.]|uniref:hypothetical protein n=1 Tax=Hyphomicrobium sp. TaxID=82 RepID=UPI000FA0AB35|nr:hypothetical protein [Hyphomicrobium sp.]RUO97677.1 MAG: hypothetical protein EKK30_12995 [Hyphomicrobium sp.]
MTRTEQAIRLRDAALQLLGAAGSWADIRDADGGTVRHLEFKNATISVSYRTPFQKVCSEPSQYDKYMAALLGIDVKANLPYGLNIWVGKKVLNIEWDSQGHIELVSFKRGPWEQDLTALGETLSQPADFSRAPS